MSIVDILLYFKKVKKKLNHFWTSCRKIQIFVSWNLLELTAYITLQNIITLHSNQNLFIVSKYWVYDSPTCRSSTTISSNVAQFLDISIWISNRSRYTLTSFFPIAGLNVNMGLLTSIYKKSSIKLNYLIPSRPNY